MHFNVVITYLKHFEDLVLNEFYIELKQVFEREESWNVNIRVQVLLALLLSFHKHSFLAADPISLVNKTLQHCYALLSFLLLRGLDLHVVFKLKYFGFEDLGLDLPLRLLLLAEVTE